jgi:hypothetical protein
VQWVGLTGSFLLIFLVAFRLRAMRPATAPVTPYFTRRESRRSASTLPPV